MPNTTCEEIKTALRTMCLWNGKTWESWESYKDRHGISELGYAGDMLNGGPVFLEKYTEHFAKGIDRLLASERQRVAEICLGAVSEWFDGQRVR